MKHTFVAFLGLLVIAGCSLFNKNLPYPDEGLNQAKGRHVDELVDKIGFPDRVDRVGNYDVYTWETIGATVSRTTTSNLTPGSVLDPTLTTRTRTPFCEIKVSVNANGIVGRGEWSGNICGRYGKLLNQ